MGSGMTSSSGPTGGTRPRRSRGALDEHVGAGHRRGRDRARHRSPTTACWRAAWWRRGVRFVQLYHEAWDQHSNLVKDLQKNCLATDRASAALIKDLKQRGLLDDTLVVWGGEFGRTPMVQGGIGRPRPSSQRASRCGWPAAASKRGPRIGETDEFGFNVVEGPRPRSRPARHHPPPAGLRSQAPDLPVPGPPVPPDRRRRQRGRCS